MGELKVRFLPKGGFEKNGAFIEYEGDEPSGDETEYQRQGYLTLDITCTDFRIGTSIGITCEFEDVEERLFRRSISATGTIQPARWGRYSLSFLGEEKSTHQIAVSICENTVGEAATLAGINMKSDLDLEGHNCFFLELQVHHERFAALLQELSTPEAVLHISARSDRFRGFYAEWSPSISEGRVIKFLDNKRDVENVDDIPQDFWRTSEFQRRLLSNPDSPPVTISVGRPMYPPQSAPTHVEKNEEDVWNMDEDTPASAPPVPASPPDPVPALEKLTKRVQRGAFWIGLWLALISLVLLLRA